MLSASKSYCRAISRSRPVVDDHSLSFAAKSLGLFAVMGGIILYHLAE
jgi:hypothetical protein